MKNSKLIYQSLFRALGVVAYVVVVSLVFSYGEQLFGKMSNFWGPVAFLLLFVLSAAIVGSLIFAKPILLYLDGLKKEAVRLLIYTISWLFLATVITLLVQAII